MLSASNPRALRLQLACTQFPKSVRCLARNGPCDTLSARPTKSKKRSTFSATCPATNNTRLHAPSSSTPPTMKSIVSPTMTAPKCARASRKSSAARSQAPTKFAPSTNASAYEGAALATRARPCTSTSSIVHRWVNTMSSQASERRLPAFATSRVSATAPTSRACMF
jgi:hypothetical protein